MRWATSWTDHTTRFSIFRLVGSGSRQSKQARTPPHSPRYGIVADDAIAYPQLPDDLEVLLRLLQDLHDDLASAQQTVERHRHCLNQLNVVMDILSDRGPNRSRDQFIADLELVFEQLKSVEDELTSSLETITFHGFKLQHLDLAMQMLVEVFADLVVGGGTHSPSSPRLQRLRLACGQALSAVQTQ